MAKTQQNQNTEDDAPTTGRKGVTYLKPGMLAGPQTMQIVAVHAGNFGKTDIEGVIGGRPTIVSVAPTNPQHSALELAFGREKSAWVGRSIRVSDDTVWRAINVTPVQ